VTRRTNGPSDSVQRLRRHSTPSTSGPSRSASLCSHAHVQAHLTVQKRSLRSLVRPATSTMFTSDRRRGAHARTRGRATNASTSSTYVSLPIHAKDRQVTLCRIPTRGWEVRHCPCTRAVVLPHAKVHQGSMTPLSASPRMLEFIFLMINVRNTNIPVLTIFAPGHGQGPQSTLRASIPAWPAQGRA